MGLPQLDGRTCVRCRHKIGSIAEGTYCSACANPVHFGCLDKPDEPIELEHCSRCGGDPNSVIATKVNDAQKTESLTSHRLTCPNCGSTSGFGPYDSNTNSYVGAARESELVGVFYLIAKLLFTGSETQCFRCLFVFRPRHKIRELGCLLLVLGGSLILVTIVMWWVLQ
ncbi:hypothetical protein BH10PLA2_BH10PLA2_34990 [soil metagenome]